VGRCRDAAGEGEPAPAVRGGTLRLVFAGTPEPAIPSLRALLDSRHEVAAVLTRPDAPAGRGRRVRSSPVADFARAHDIEVLIPRRPSEPEFLDQLRTLAPDCCPVVAYGALVPPAALEIPPRGWVNLHFSLLPAWRGAAPVQRALMAGDDVTGASTFLLEQGMDTGPIYGVVTETVRPDDTAGDLLDRLAVSGADLLVATLDGIESGELQARPQRESGVSLAPKVAAEDAEVDWSAPAVAVDRRIRGATPAPGAWTTFRGQRIKVGPVTPEPDSAGLGLGELRVGDGVVRVGTATQSVRLGDVQPSGKRPMPAADWARGVRPTPGERLQ
jgi:methionyl-tRNA formyltransferase